jgi:uncharacterized membrane protein
MAFCRNCGSQVEGKYCPKCGTPVVEAASGSGPGFAASGSGQGAASGGGAGASSGLQDNVASALAYVPLLGAIFFLWLLPDYKQNRKVRFHAWQALYLFLGLFLLRWAVAILLPYSIELRLDKVIGIGGTILWIFLGYKAYTNEKVVLPVIGPLAEKQV